MIGHWWKLLDGKELLTILASCSPPLLKPTIPSQDPTTVKYLPPVFLAVLAFSWLCCNFILSGSNSSHLEATLAVDKSWWVFAVPWCFQQGEVLGGWAIMSHELLALYYTILGCKWRSIAPRNRTACWTPSHRDWWLWWFDHIWYSSQTRMPNKGHSTWNSLRPWIKAIAERIQTSIDKWAMVNTHYMVDGHPIHNKDPYNGYYQSLWTIGWLAPINGY